jgi:hypothetical protein
MEVRTIKDRAGEVQALGRDFEVVLDTNVFLETFSIGDLMKEGYRLGAEGDPMKDSLCRFRIGRTYHGLALAVAFHLRESETFGIGDESAAAMRRLVPTDDPSQPDYHFVIHLTNLVKERILTGWTPTVTQNLSGDLSNPDRDSLLLEIAKLIDRPLVTNEGNTHKGLADKRLRRLARDAGVDVLCPMEMNKRWGVDTDGAWRWLLTEFDENAAAYLDSFERSKRKVMHDGLVELRGILETVGTRGKEAAIPLPRS